MLASYISLAVTLIYFLVGSAVENPDKCCLVYIQIYSACVHGRQSLF